MNLSECGKNCRPQSLCEEVYKNGVDTGNERYERATRALDQSSTSFWQCWCCQRHQTLVAGVAGQSKGSAIARTAHGKEKRGDDGQCGVNQNHPGGFYWVGSQCSRRPLGTVPTRAQAADGKGFKMYQMSYHTVHTHDYSASALSGSQTA